jgi:predicted transcriptional regulator of viral defense system
MNTKIQTRSHPRQLPRVFTYAQARESGISKHEFYKLRDHGNFELLARGLFRWVNDDVTDLTLSAITRLSPLATLCLESALVHHNLSDAIPSAYHVALPRGTRHPALESPVQWHSFDAKTFKIGRNVVALEDTNSIGMYSEERCIVDAFRLRGIEGSDVAYEALRRWVRRPHRKPAKLIQMASHFPNVSTPLIKALQILL